MDKQVCKDHRNRLGSACGLLSNEDVTGTEDQLRRLFEDEWEVEAFEPNTWIGSRALRSMTRCVVAPPLFCWRGGGGGRNGGGEDESQDLFPPYRHGCLELTSRMATAAVSFKGQFP